MRSIYHYLDYRAFLKDWQIEHQSQHPGFSIRAFLKKAEIRSPSFFRQIVLGQRNLTESTLSKFLNALHLKRNEAEYFRSLVHFCQSHTSEEKQHHYRNLLSLGNQAKICIVGEESYSFYEHWYTSAIRELICLPDFNGDIHQLAQKLQPAISVAEARKAIQILQEHQFIQQNAEGRYQQTSPLLHTGFEVHSLAIRRFNQQMVELAAQSLNRFSPQERNITGVTLSASSRTYHLIEEEIRAFQDRILKLVEKDDHADRVYQMNVMLFPLSQKSTQEESP